MITTIKRITDYKSSYTSKGSDLVIAYVNSTNWNVEYAEDKIIKNVTSIPYTYSYEMPVEEIRKENYNEYTYSYDYSYDYIYHTYSYSYNIVTYEYYTYDYISQYIYNYEKTGKTYTYFTGNANAPKVGYEFAYVETPVNSIGYYLSYQIKYLNQPEVFISYSYNTYNDGMSSNVTYVTHWINSYTYIEPTIAYTLQKDNVSIPLSLIKHGKITKSIQDVYEPVDGANACINSISFKYDTNNIIKNVIKVYDGSQGDKGRKGYKGIDGVEGVDAITYALKNTNFALDTENYGYILINNNPSKIDTPENLSKMMFSSVAAKEITDTINNLNSNVLTDDQYANLVTSQQDKQDTNYFTFEEDALNKSNKVYKISKVYTPIEDYVPVENPNIPSEPENSTDSSDNANSNDALNID